MDRVDKLEVYIGHRKVGTMALHKRFLAAFEYSDEWLADGYSISPFSLPLEKKVFIPKIDPFDGIFGVFSDSLPDGWGRLLVDRLMKRHHIDPVSMGNLERLAIVGDTGMGALTYRPQYTLPDTNKHPDLDRAAEECCRILENEDSSDLDYLFANGGSSGGARPKIFTKIDGEDWIIKFPAYGDPSNIGRQEYDYACCAVECGIAMSEVRLFPSKKCEGYFGTKRFDRSGSNGEGRIHMVSASGLLETSHRIPNLDYELLMRLTLQLTKSMEECMKLYRLMCFNVFAHNRDDHSKNFTYQYIENEKRWILSPAYDLTYSNSLGGEHAITVHGNGIDPGIEDLLSVAKGIGIRKTAARKTAEDIRECVSFRLKDYL
ncbi:MAG: type II toxin-antitoxin system HipA family toxin [Eubacteriales bacterium]|nr:type II toxin-antitoxin system HipA family toxin [Eubacteriales bacterium]